MGFSLSDRGADKGPGAEAIKLFQTADMPPVPSLPAGFADRLIKDAGECSRIFQMDRPVFASASYVTRTSKTGDITKTFSQFQTVPEGGFAYDDLTVFEKIDGVLSRHFVVKDGITKLRVDGLQGRTWWRDFEASAPDIWSNPFETLEVRRYPGVEQENFRTRKAVAIRPFLQMVRFEGCAKSEQADYPSPTSIWSVRESHGPSSMIEGESSNIRHYTVHLEISSDLGWYTALTDGGDTIYRLSSVMSEGLD